MNGVTRFHTLRWIRVNSGSISGCEVEEFIDTTRNYFKTVWADGYTEITKLHVTHTGQAIKEIKTSSNLSVYKSPKVCYNICVSKTKEPRSMKIKSDERLNPMLQEQISSLRGDILSQTLKEESERFTVTPSTENPTVFITDTTTSKQAEVPLFASRAVLEALNTLFKEA